MEINSLKTKVQEMELTYVPMSTYKLSEGIKSLHEYTNKLLDIVKQNPEEVNGNEDLQEILIKINSIETNNEEYREKVIS